MAALGRAGRRSTKDRIQRYAREKPQKTQRGSRNQTT